mmetsp:Transcript_20300/g.22672  ORF Transcript_20300/g.22672 Transcript_20300/m.22672 type:complete len:130 (-) Transcript_20300:23-412(-)
MNTAFGEFTYETHASDYAMNTTFLHTTGNINECYKSPLAHNLTTSLDQHLNSIWTTYAKTTKTWSKGDRKYSQIDLTFDEENDFTFITGDGYILSLNGTFAKHPFSQNVTSTLNPIAFSRAHHLPEACR